MGSAPWFPLLPIPITAALTNQMPTQDFEYRRSNTRRSTIVGFRIPSKRLRFYNLYTHTTSLWSFEAKGPSVQKRWHRSFDPLSHDYSGLTVRNNDKRLGFEYWVQNRFFKTPVFWLGIDCPYSDLDMGVEVPTQLFWLTHNYSGLT